MLDQPNHKYENLYLDFGTPPGLTSWIFVRPDFAIVIPAPLPNQWMLEVRVIDISFCCMQNFSRAPRKAPKKNVSFQNDKICKLHNG